MQKLQGAEEEQQAQSLTQRQNPGLHGLGAEVKQNQAASSNLLSERKIGRPTLRSGVFGSLINWQLLDVCLELGKHYSRQHFS